MNAVPHGLDPLATQNTKHDHERVKKVTEMPPRNAVKLGHRVVTSEQLHSHHGENEDDDCKNEAEVTERPHRPTNNSDEQVERGP